MKEIISSRFAGVGLALLLSTALAAADDGGGRGGSRGDHGSDHSSDGGSSNGSRSDGGKVGSGSSGSSFASAASTRSVGALAYADRGGNGSAHTDQDQTRKLVEHGLIHPLRDILARVRDQAPGDVVGINLSRRSGRWVYTLEVLTPTGMRVDVAVDGGTMVILSVGQ